MTLPVYVPSRGRPDSRTATLLRGEGIEHRLVVEPQERTAYLAAGARRDQILVLPEGDQGLAYVRQFVLDHARRWGTDWFWMLDDDVTAFHYFPGKRGARVRARRALDEAAAHFVDEADCEQAALEYQQYAWSARKPAVENSYCDVVVAIRTSTRAEFRPETNLKVDRDFTLQVLAGGATTRRVTEFAFSAPTMGTNEGGLWDEYRAGRERESSEKMAELWPECVTVATKPNGRVDARIDWRAARGGNIQGQ